jgi:F0F1-type ATP synthase membrane subunit a
MLVQFLNVHVMNTVSLPTIKEKESVKSVTSDVEIVIAFSITVLTVLLQLIELTHHNVDVLLVY